MKNSHYPILDYSCVFRRRSISKFFLTFIILFLIFGCGGGFLSENENAKEFNAPLFNLDELDTTQSE